MQACFGRKDLIYELLILNRDAQREDCGPCFPPPEFVAKPEDDTFGDGEQIQQIYQRRLAEMERAIRVLRNALDEAETERENLQSLQRAVSARLARP